jgi:hypothetical protein
MLIIQYKRKRLTQEGIPNKQTTNEITSNQKQ